MEQKKSNSVNLERKRGAFFFMGLVMTTAVVGMAFEYENFVKDEYVEVVQGDDLEVEMVFELPEEEEIIEEKKTVIPPPIIDDPIIIDDQDQDEEPDFTFIDDDFDPDMFEDPEPPIVEEPILDFAPVEPEFIGGETAMRAWIADNIEYPPLAAEMGQEGKVYVQFVVNKNGTIEQVKIRQGVSDALDAEAKRVVKKMPKWKPGENAGKPVRVRFTLPIHFRLG